MQIKLHSAIIQFAKVLVGDLNKPTEPINQKTRKRKHDTKNKNEYRVKKQTI